MKPAHVRTGMGPATERLLQVLKYPWLSIEKKKKKILIYFILR
jgi:hypothetical protein